MISINNIISKIGSDKLLHLLVCIVLMFELKRFLPIWLAITITIFVIIIKEVYDKLSGQGTPDWKDILWGILGLIIGCL